MERKNRNDEPIPNNGRDERIKQALRMEFQDRFYIPPNEIPDGFEYYWVRDSVFGEPDEHRIIQMQNKGWTFVPASRHPHRTQSTVPWRPKTDKSNFIFEGGLVLCERPLEYGKIEQETIRNYNYKVMQSIPGEENLMNDPVLPGRVFQNQTTISKVQNFKED
jgi:hypothetical protein